MSDQGGWGSGGSPPGFGGVGGAGADPAAPAGGSPGWGSAGTGPAGPGGFGGYGPPPGAPPGEPLGSTSWGPGEAVSFAWQRIKADPGTVLGALIVAEIIGNLASSIGNGLTNLDDSLTFQLIGGGFSLVNFVVMSFMMGGMVVFSLKVARGQPYEFGDIFQGMPYFGPILVANLLTGIGVGFGMILLIVPGIILALGWSMAAPLIVDRRLGPIDAMKRSWAITTGHKSTLFLFGLLMMGVALLGLLACCVGVLVAGPIGYIAWAFIYLRITGQSTAPPTAA